MPTLDEVALTERRQRALAQIRNLTATRLSAMWLRLGSYDKADQRRWVARADPVLRAGQNRAVDLQIAYLAARLGSPVRFSRADVLAKAVLDVTEPFFAFGRALNAGRGYREAFEAGRLRAYGVGESGVQWASRAAGTAVDGDERIRGWRRTLVGVTCEWCQVVSTQRYRTAESASFGHLRCDCEPTPIIGDSDPGRVINSRLLGQLKSSGAVDRVSAARARSRS